MGKILNGVCCEFCRKNETSECPIPDARNWSKWKDFCSQFDPAKNNADAKPLISAVLEQCASIFYEKPK